MFRHEVIDLVRDSVVEPIGDIRLIYRYQSALQSCPSLRVKPSHGLSLMRRWDIFWTGLGISI